jgi:hypothetical protein
MTRSRLKASVADSTAVIVVVSCQQRRQIERESGWAEAKGQPTEVKKRVQWTWRAGWTSQLLTNDRSCTLPGLRVARPLFGSNTRGNL